MENYIVLSPQFYASMISQILLLCWKYWETLPSKQWEVAESPQKIKIAFDDEGIEIRFHK
jgi:hypothetical protein